MRSVGITYIDTDIEKTKATPAITPGIVSGSVTCTKRWSGLDPSVAAASEQARIDQLHHREDRQDHERQEDVDGAEDEARLGEEEPHRRVDDADAEERPVHDAVASQEDRPRERLDHDADGQRQDQRRQQRALERAGRPRRGRSATG